MKGILVREARATLIGLHWIESKDWGLMSKAIFLSAPMGVVEAEAPWMPSMVISPGFAVIYLPPVLREHLDSYLPTLKLAGFSQQFVDLIDHSCSVGTDVIVISQLETQLPIQLPVQHGKWRTWVRHKLIRWGPVTPIAFLVGYLFCLLTYVIR